jgi:hypothetical protein
MRIVHSWENGYYIPDFAVKSNCLHGAAAAAVMLDK